MHGGALVSLADTAVVMAIKSLLPPQTHFATIALETKFLYPVKKGLVTAKAEVSKQDGRNLQGKAILYDDEERAVLEFSSTFKVAKDSVIRGVSFDGSDSLQAERRKATKFSNLDLKKSERWKRGFLSKRARE
jgi:uncharacterized protein (TIGR00369 family)